jgi:hypothetical protein
MASTILAGDGDNTNDTFTQDVTHLLEFCMPRATSGCGVDGIKRFILADIDADDGGDGCNDTGDVPGYVDRRNLSTSLDRSTGNNVYTLQAQQNWSGGANIEKLSVWIDFNDNGTFETSERLISGENFRQFGTLEDFILTIPTDATIGSHVLRAKAIDTSASGDILDACSDFAFGEVHDYTIVIEDTLSTDIFDLNQNTFTINTLPNNQFEIILKTHFNKILDFNLFNISGQQIVFNNMRKSNAEEYRYELDMSYASSGVYIVKLGRDNTYEVGKIIVK